MRQKITVLWFVTAIPCIFRGMPCLPLRDRRDHSPREVETDRAVGPIAAAGSGVTVPLRHVPLLLPESRRTEVAR